MSLSLSLLLPVVVKRSWAWEAVIVRVTLFSWSLTLWAVAVFWPLPLSAWKLSVASCLVSILGSISVTPWPLSAWAVAVFWPLPLPPWACAFPCLSGGVARSFAIARSPESLAWPLAVSVRLPASPARLRAVEAGRLARRGPQEGVEAFVSQPPVAWSSGGRPSCWRGVYCRSPVCFCRSLPSSSWACLAPLPWEHLESWQVWPLLQQRRGVSRARLRLLLGRPLFVLRLWRLLGLAFCLLLPLLVLACLVTSSVRACPALAGVAVGRLVMGPIDVLRALQRKVSFFC